MVLLLQVLPAAPGRLGQLAKVIALPMFKLPRSSQSAPFTDLIKMGDVLLVTEAPCSAQIVAAVMEV